MNKFTCLYVRVSKDTQENSIDTQLELLQNYCKYKNLEIDKTFDLIIFFIIFSLILYLKNLFRITIFFIVKSYIFFLSDFLTTSTSGNSGI